MNILFVDDMPEFKVYKAIQYLKEQKLDFSYEIVKSINSASRYLDNHFKEIDLVILDLGLPYIDQGSIDNKLNGLIVLNKILFEDNDIPIIINSTTEIPDEENYLKFYINEGANIKHVKFLDGEWLFEFLKQI